ncbi:hypothetical protein, partial [Deinococcus aquaticus]|uniref:hypothetical protein n=1 Tax=Deinococcus aquaticus TaxID=328692 RepID=UPI003616299E
MWCVVEAFHAVLRVRREVPGMTWRAAQRQAAQNAEKYVLTGMEQDGPCLTPRDTTSAGKWKLLFDAF